MKRTFAILIILLPFVTACRDEVKSEDLRTKFTIVHPSRDTSYDAGRIIFRSVKQKDERTLAMEKAAGNWNRNLYLMAGSPSLAEFADSSGIEK